MSHKNNIQYTDEDLDVLCPFMVTLRKLMLAGETEVTWIVHKQLTRALNVIGEML